jgi:hypothetical protein
VFVDRFELGNNHDDFNEKIWSQLFEVFDVLIIYFSSVKIRRVEYFHGIFLDQLDYQDSTVFLSQVKELIVRVKLFGQNFPLVQMAFKLPDTHTVPGLFNQ